MSFSVKFFFIEKLLTQKMENTNIKTNNIRVQKLYFFNLIFHFKNKILINIINTKIMGLKRNKNKYK